MMRKKDLPGILLFFLLLAAAIWGARAVEGAENERETEQVRSAIRKAAITCYAIEGAYPESMAYLREHYRLAYDEERYLVTYDAFAENQLPDIYVTERGQRQP